MTLMSNGKDFKKHSYIKMKSRNIDDFCLYKILVNKKLFNS